MLVCHCFRVYDKDIRQCKDLKQVREKTFATMGCGGCRPAVVQILQVKDGYGKVERESDE